MMRASALGGALALLATSLAFPLTAGADHRIGNRGHWDRIPPNVAHVKFLDYTGAAWPVGTAHLDWDVADRIDVDWVLADGSSICGSDCVRVRTRAPSEDFLFGPNCTGWAGYWTNYVPDGKNHWTEGNEVRFNRSCNDAPARARRALTCQELGHALGLAHAQSSDSCMWKDASEADITPGGHDYHMLNEHIYTEHG